MDPVLLLAFLTTTLLFIAVPGPSVAFATAQAVRHGPRAALIALGLSGVGVAMIVKGRRALPQN